MKRSVLTAGMVLAATTLAFASSVNDSIILRTAGSWQSYYTARNSEGNPMCGISSTLNPGTANGANGGVYLKYDVGPNIYFHVWKSSWSIPRNTEFPVFVQFDNGEQYKASAVGGPARFGKGGSVNFLIADSFLKEFMELFADARTMKIGFSEGSERPWTVDMRGSTEIAESFRTCIATVVKRAPTQPFGSGGNATPPQGGGTQPFGTPSVPSTKIRDNGV